MNIFYIFYIMIIILIIIIIIIIYQDLKREVKRIWNMRSVIVVPVVIGALGSITKKLNEWLEKLELAVNIVLLQKTTLLGTARILRKVLEY